MRRGIGCPEGSRPGNFILVEARGHPVRKGCPHSNLRGRGKGGRESGEHSGTGKLPLIREGKEHTRGVSGAERMRMDV